MSNLEERLMQAEFVASHELAEDLGVWMEFAERAGRTAQQQFQVWLQDQQTFMQALARGEAPLQAFADHAARSSGHCMEGLQAAVDLYAEQTQRLLRLHEMFWSPLLRGGGSRQLPAGR
jgi:hypothetical protein